MKVIIITEGDAKIGFGHISRCCSLYQAFIEKKIYPCLIVKGDETISMLLKTFNNIIFDWIENSIKLHSIINKTDILVIDSYSYNDSISIKLSDSVRIPVYIDDNNRIKYPRGIVINSAVHANDLNYPNNPDIKYLLGPQYTMLKKTFWVNQKKNFNNKIKSILITFGGSDIRNLTPKLIKILKIKFPNIKKKIIIGRNYQNIKEIKELIDQNCELIYFPNSEGMKEIMLSSDIAITSGGQTAYELASVGVPAITIAVAQNQINSVNKLNELGINFYSGWWENKDLFKKIELYIEKLQNLQIRKQMIDQGFKYIRSDGSRKIIEILIKIFNNKIQMNKNIKL